MEFISNAILLIHCYKFFLHLLINDKRALMASQLLIHPHHQCLQLDKWPVITPHTHTHPFNGPFSGTTRVGRYQKGKTYLDFTGARDSEWQWHQLGHMQVCTSLQRDNHASTPSLSFLQAGCPSCRPTNSVKALKAKNTANHRPVNRAASLSQQVTHTP